MQGAVLTLHQQGADALVPHGLHLTGHARHQDSTAALLLKPCTGGSAVVVDDLMPLYGHHGLLAVVGGGHPAGAGKITGDLLPLALVKDQRIAIAGGNGLLGQVVCRGAQTAGEYQQVTAVLCLVDKVRQPPLIVADGALPLDRNAQLSKLPAQVLGVGVEDVAEQQLGAHTDDLRCHAAHPSNSISSVMRMRIRSVFSAASASSSARPGMAASASRISASSGRIFGCGGVKMVQQSS